MIPEALRLELQEGATAWFASDLHLAAEPSGAVPHLAAALDGLPDGSVAVLGGDVLELLGLSENADPAALLCAHPALVDALERARADRGVQVVWLIGNHDVRLLWDDDARARVAQVLPDCRFALAVDLEVPTGAGTQRVWFEHGNQSDPLNRFSDPTNPNDTPFGHHVVREVLPMMRALLGGWVDDATTLAVPATFPTFITSRLFYRRFLARWRWAALVLVALFVLRLTATLAANAAPTGAGLAKRIVELAFIGLIDVVVVVLAAAFVAHRAATRIAEAPALVGARGLNRLTADELSGDNPDHVGVVTGHTHVPELRDRGTGFYANPGCSCQTVRALRATAGLPPVFQRSSDVGWVLVSGGAEGVQVELHRGCVPDLVGMTPIERWVTRAGVRRSRGDALGDHGNAITPRRIAAWPAGPTAVEGASSPQHPSRTRLIRRVAALLVAASAGVTVISSLSPPAPERLAALRRLMPLALPLAATGGTVVVGVALAVLALGLARGQRRAHRATVVLLAAATVGHLVKGIDVEEAIVTGACLVALLAAGRRFTVPARTEGLGRRLAVLAGVVLAGVVVGVADLEAHSVRPLGEATLLAVERLFGLALPGVYGSHFVAAGLVGLGLAAVLVGAVLVFQRPRAGPTAGVDPDVRKLVRARATDSLAYFALRDDKQHFVYGDSVVAYGVFGRVALVSPDPIGPPGDLERVITAFRSEAIDQGWIVAVLAAAPEPAQRYAALGLRTMYLGDEGIARFDRFRLDLRGSHYKPMRGSVNRAIKAGYRVELHDPVALTDQQRAALDQLVAVGRRGEAERGFSMTLGRLYDPADEGLLLSVAWHEDGTPGAFCQFVPAPDVGGWSLDVMRRHPDTPNGIMEYLLIETMRHLQSQGCTGVGLNFATFRAVVDPKATAEETLSARLERRVLHSLSELFQIESLLMFNAKFYPEWRPRYLVYESPAHLPEIGIAVARAESFWEIPVVGRFFRPDPAGIVEQPPQRGDSEGLAS
ncbi:MAG: phosphatidylglycerol lysyltransferase domain-containing protein [Egibacteraceae bacterium]